MDHQYVINTKHTFPQRTSARRAGTIAMAKDLTTMDMSLTLIHHTNYVQPQVPSGMAQSVYSVHIPTTTTLTQMSVRSACRDRHTTKYRSSACSLDIIRTWLTLQDIAAMMIPTMIVDLTFALRTGLFTMESSA